MSKVFAAVIGSVLLLALLTFSTTYRVAFNEVAIVTTFGEAKGAESVVREPGLKFKLPKPMQAVRTFDTRLQLRDSRLDTVPTKDGLQVVVQAYLLWRIDDSPQGVLAFAQSNPSMDAASNDLESRLRDAKDVISQFNFDELIGADSRLAEAEQAMLRKLEAKDDPSRSLASVGIKPVAIGFSQVLLPPDTSANVVKRMQEERQIRAEEERQKGEAEYRRIVSEGTQKAGRIIAFAQTLAEQIRAEGDELATESIEIMSEDEEFAIFLVWLEAFEKTVANNATLILPPTLPPFHLANYRADVKGIPWPDQRLAAALEGDRPRRSAGADEPVSLGEMPLVKDEDSDESSEGGQ